MIWRPGNGAKQVATSSMKFILVFAAILAVSSAAIVVKRRALNSYGDEVVVPAGGGAPVVVVEEQPSTRIHQGYSSYSAGVQSSGYGRMKRAGGNAYGDEQVMPPGGGAQEAYRPVVEQASAQVPQYTVKNEAAVVSSGYR